MATITKPRYILNMSDKTAHNRYGLTENCNTDQIKVKNRSVSIPDGYKLCQWCNKNE